MKYIVMECRSAYAVVLGDDGRFLKVANLHYQVGQTVTDVVELETPIPSPQTETKRSPRWISSLATLAACLVLVMTGLFWNSQSTYASVYLRINPEIRVDVNRNDIVLSAQGVNEDGAALLEGYDYRKKDLDTVMDELVDRAIEMDYLHEGGKITLSLEGNAAWVSSHETHLNDQLTAYLGDRITVTIDIAPREPIPSQPTVPPGTIHIPVGGDTDYGETDYGTTLPDGDHRDEDWDDDDRDDDDDSDDNHSPYESKDPEDDGMTDYGTSDDQNAQDGDSDYEDDDDEEKDE